MVEVRDSRSILLEGMENGTTAGVFAVRRRLALRENQVFSHGEIIEEVVYSYMITGERINHRIGNKSDSIEKAY